jgi:hypothetical protein
MNTTLEAEKKVKSGASIFEAMTDQRKLKAIRYQFQPLLILLSLSKLCLPDRPSEIAHWVTNPSAWLKEKLRLQWKPMPSLSTWQTLIANHLDASEFDKKVCQYFQSLSSEQQQLLNLDGKVVCRAIAKETNKQLYLVALQESGNNPVVEQTALAKRKMKLVRQTACWKNPILFNKIVSGDAIFAQPELSQKAVEKGGEDLWKLRAKQGRIYDQAKNYFESQADK